MNEHPMTSKILHWFTEISKIPRQSRHEENICAWMMEWAQKHKFDAKKDTTGNIVIKVPSSPGYESGPIVVLQGHLDMVCEKKPESPHDFSKDPIRLVYQGEWLTADKTTLGADNGIGLALALTLALESEVKHSPLELLFTVDEETGLTGAKGIQPGFLKGKILINVDSENEGYFTVGCAGGKNTDSSIPLEFAVVPSDYKVYEVKVGELKGGHSGIDIASERANAIRLLARTLASILVQTRPMLYDIKGGSAHNAIPRDAQATVLIPPSDQEKVKGIVAQAQKTFSSEFKNTDPDLKVELTEIPKPDGKAVSFESMQKAVNFVMAIPHGVAAMSTAIKGLVETSNNLATIALQEGRLKVLTSQRSSVMSRLQDLTDRIEAIAKIAGGTAESSGGYPSWEPNMNSPLLARCKEVYKNKFGKDPVVEAVHAGLECGIIGSKYEGMDMISLGPTLKNPHSPNEKLYIPSIGKVWDFLVELLKTFK